jgi:hypothetical protein
MTMQMGNLSSVSLVSAPRFPASAGNIVHFHLSKGTRRETQGILYAAQLSLRLSVPGMLKQCLSAPGFTFCLKP